MKLCVPILLVFVALCSADFSAQVTVTNDPSLRGTISGKIWWTSSFMRIDWNLGVSQVWDYDTNVVYKKCTSCESATMTDAVLQFEKDSTFSSAGTSQTFNGVSCTKYTSNGNVKVLFADSNGKPCQAQLVNGKTFTFSNLVASVDSSQFDTSSWNCPTKKCFSAADVVVVVDKSGSISNTEWAQATSFVKQFSDSFAGFQTQAYYNSNPSTAVRMGLVWFDTWGYDKTIAYGNSGVGGVTADKTTFYNAANSERGSPGWTNIGDGINHGLNMLYQSSRGVNKMILFLTDGVETKDYTPLADQLARLKSYLADPSRRLTTYSVGVGTGDALDTNNLLHLAGDNPDHYVPVGTYSQLASKLQTIFSKTCPENTDSVCTCKGFCACGGKCLCPDSCPAGKCSVSQCSSGTSGCEDATPVVCTPSTMCVDAHCDPSQGTNGTCVETPKVCPGDSCHTTVCNPLTGCGLDGNLTKICSDYTEGCTTCDMTKPKGSNCFTSNTCKCQKNQCDITVKACQFQTCNPNTGSCESKTVQCDDGNPCTDDSCDPNGLGVCEFKPKSCDDGNACTTDTCDSSTKTGCVHTPRNATLECNDYSVCTNDTCDPSIGCVNLPLPCVNVNGTDPCVNTTCDPILGCLALPTDCYAANANISLLVGDCQTVQCNSTAGCYLRPIDGAQIDDCGVCKGSTRPFFCNKAAVAGIAAGVIAGATVGAVAGAVALGFGAKKGYDFLSDRSAASGGIQNNPLYVDNTNNNNPMFNG